MEVSASSAVMSRRFVTTRWSCASAQMLPVRPMIHLSGSGFGQYGSIANVCVSWAASETERHATRMDMTCVRIRTSGDALSISYGFDTAVGHAIEEVHQAGFERVLGTNDDEAVLLDELLEDVGPMP